MIQLKAAKASRLRSSFLASNGQSLPNCGLFWKLRWTSPAQMMCLLIGQEMPE